MNRNSQGLTLRIDDKLNYLLENSNRPEIGDFVTWKLDTLHRRLLEKHNETFWIAAKSHKEDGKEYFFYEKVQHTKKPIASQFDILLGQGIITLDHLIKRNSDGKVIEKRAAIQDKTKCSKFAFPSKQNI